MRKVTASAVILAALSGCNQSGGVPSSQWSFEPPVDDQASNAQASVQKNVQNAKASSHNSRLAGLQLSADAQPFVDISNQPSNTAVTDSKGLPSSNLISAALSSSRPDPVAQAKAYLRTSAAPNILTSRTPGQVIPYSAAQTVAQNVTQNVRDAQSYLSTTYYSSPTYSSVLPGSQSAQGSSANPTLVTTGEEPQPAYGAFVLPVAASTPTPVATSNSSSALNVNYPSMTRDGLPQLVPSPAVPISNSAQPESEVPIGTAILNDLQRSASRPVALPGDLSVDRPIDLSVEPPIDLFAPVASETSAAPAMPAMTMTGAVETAAPIDKSEPTEQLTDSIATPLADPLGSPTNSEAQSQPTLTRLLQTLPTREASPLVLSDHNWERPSDLSAISTASPLLSSLREARLSSEIYLPMVEAASANAAPPLAPTNFLPGSGFSAEPASELPSVEWGDALPQKVLIKLNQQQPSSSRRQVVTWR